MVASFAVPLLKVLHHPNFVVDFAGVTSQGKTTAQRAAGSVWGCVDEAQPEMNVLQSWNATQVGVSEMGRILSGLPLILDDSKTARNAKSVAEILYLIVGFSGSLMWGICGAGRYRYIDRVDRSVDNRKQNHENRHTSIS